MNYDRTAPSVSLLIGERELSSGSGGVFAHINPATGEHQADIPLAGPAEVNQAVACASQAFEVWGRMPGAQRGMLLNRLADLIAANTSEFVRLAAIEGGTPITIGAGGPCIGEEWTRYYGGWADKIDGQVVSMPPAEELIYTRPEPYGVIGIIIT